MGKCLVLIGPSGSGKTTFTEKFLKDNPSFKVVSDEIVRKYYFGVTMKLSDKLEKDLVNDLVYKYLAQGLDVIVDGGPIKARDRKSLLNYIGKIEDAQISCVEFVTPLEVCKERTSLKKRDFEKNCNAYQSPSISEGWHGIMRYSE